jgi:flagella basal body P-ring formation protein FlgA
MHIKSVCVIAVWCLLMAAEFCQSGDAESDASLTIYLPRQIELRQETVTLGQVGIIRGGESLAAEAGKIVLGRLSAPGQNMTIDRSMILSRLACHQIPASKVELTGAEEVTVTQKRDAIKGDEFVELAESFLRENFSGGSICQAKAVRIPQDFVLPGSGEELKTSACLIGSGSGNPVKVRIMLLAGDRQIGVREVDFRVQYNSRRVVTSAQIPAGAVFTPENTRIETAASNQAEPVGWKAPYGLICKRQLAANTVIGPNMAAEAKPQVIIKRNQNVVIRIEKGGLVVMATGKAMQNGCSGEYVKVKNADSQRIILAKVKEDGTVEPVL